MVNIVNMLHRATSKINYNYKHTYSLYLLYAFLVFCLTFLSISYPVNTMLLVRYAVLMKSIM